MAEVSETSRPPAETSSDDLARLKALVSTASLPPLPPRLRESPR